MEECRVLGRARGDAQVSLQLLGCWIFCLDVSYGWIYGICVWVIILQIFQRVLATVSAQCSCSGQIRQVLDLTLTLTKDKQTTEDELAQANSNISDLIAQVHASSQNCRVLQSELVDITNEKETIVSSLQQRLVIMERSKKDEIQKLTGDLDICNSRLTQVNSTNSELVTQVHPLHANY